ncbi:hypothetical protein PRK78_001935 [Emydomyces testavorans]|uniref:CRIB domain-containing protein n=1 Tax=Emydomyces testavorans TaxID=2070801 RepID=A0AAF0DDL9_9EURO|nr:hypothetical protein PRK78_001935 [Emydomyces testavorans]
MSFFNVDATSTSSRPNTASSHSLLNSSLYNDQIYRQFPPMSSSSTLSDISAAIRLRSRTQSPKRRSVFRNRSRSNTSNSTSSYQSPASSMTSIDGSSRRSSQDGRALSSFFLPEKESLAKSLFSRGSRILKRQGSKASLVAHSSFDQEEEMVRDRSRERSKERHGLSDKERSEGLGIFYRSHRPRYSDMHESLKRNISEPFDFQHVTHTNQSQLPPIEYTHLHDLATEFSIIRASQRPDSELKGIRAESLFREDLSSEDLLTTNLMTLAPDSQSLYTRSPPRSPISVEIPKSPKDLSNKRVSRSVENFSRPVTRINRLNSTPSIIPPPRVSSRSACSPPVDPTSQTINALLGLDSPPAVPRHIPSTLDDSLANEPQTSPFDLTAYSRDEPVHASTSNDYPSKMLRTFPDDHVSGLANIPEENESSWRNSRAGAHMSLKLTASPVECGQPLLTVDSAFRPEDLHSPIIPATGDQPRDLKPSVKVQPALEDSWEDDIDYCYEHAAESNSNFDWQRVSLQDVKENFAAFSLDESFVMNASYENPEKLCPLPRFGSVGEDRSAPTTPESQAAFSFPRPGSVSPGGSAKSFEFLPSPGKKLGKYSPEPLRVLGPPLEDRLSPLPMYGGTMPDIQESDEEADYAQPDGQTTSARSSCAPLSKCNSQESMILSRAASIARKHRSSTSTNNVPDLIHSPSSSRETVNRDSASPMIEQVISFAPRSPVSTIHTRSGSLGQDAVRSPTSSFSDLQLIEKRAGPATPSHDRAKSESVLDTFDTSVSLKRSCARKRSSTYSRGINHRKARTSYSLFPPTTPPTPK